MDWNSLSWRVGHGYDANGFRASQSFQGTDVVTFAPNALGQPTKAGTYATGVTYYPNGAMAGFTYGNGIAHSMQQNARQLPLKSRDAYGTSAVPLDHTYSYDENGNVLGITDGTDTTRNRAMVYDNLDRLTQMTSLGMLGGTGKIFYTYDGLDNITAVSSPNRSQRYCYDANNRLEFLRAGATVVCPNGAAMVAFGYDVQGNLAYKNNVNFVFDLGNRLRGTNGGVSSGYVYDALGRRARDYVTSSKYSLYTQAGQLAHTSDANGSAEYIYLNGSLVAIARTPSGGSTATVEYQHTDALGTPVATSTASRQITKSDYEPYGRVLNRAVKDGPGFTGHVEDAATGLTYMQQRYYDPLVGLFLSVDPVSASPSAVSRYWYANNNPFKFSDPDGRQSCSDACLKLRVASDRVGAGIKGFGGSAIASFLTSLNAASAEKVHSSERAAVNYFAILGSALQRLVGKEFGANMEKRSSNDHRIVDIHVGDSGGDVDTLEYQGPYEWKAILHTHPGGESFSGLGVYGMNGKARNVAVSSDIQQAIYRGTSAYVVSPDMAIRKFDYRGWNEAMMMAGEGQRVGTQDFVTDF